jgi:PAS domain S-box-containing protein
MRKIKNKGFYQLFIVLIVVSLLLTVTSIVIIYRIVYQEKKVLLKELCVNQKTIIQSIYNGQKDIDAVLDALYKQKAITGGLGITGEFIVGYKKNDSIYFLLKSRQHGDIDYTPIRINNDKAIPLQYALSKNTGFVQGLDYKGNLVLAYCTYIPELKWGLVTKMDVSEVRKPFFKTGIYALIASFILVLAAIFFFRKVSDPMVKQIEESEQNYHKLFEYSAIAIWRQDYTEIKEHFDNLKNLGVTDFRTYFVTHQEEIKHLASLVKVVEINQTSLALFDAGKKEDVIKNMLFYFNEESLEVFREEITLLAEGAKQIESEMPIRTLSGAIKIISLHLAVLKGFEDTLSNVLVSFIDITERKKAKDALSKMSTLMSESQKIAHLGSFEYIAASQTTVWSEEEFRIYGLDPAGPSPQYEEMLKNCIHPEDAQLLNDTFAAAMSSKSVYELEHRIVLPDGSVRYVYDLAHPYFDSNGELLRYVGATLDITERKKTEEAIAASEREFRLLTESMPQIVWTTTADGLNTYFNHQWVEYTGMTLEESYGTGWNIPFHPDDQQLAWNAWQNAVQYRAPYMLQCRLRRADGAYRWWLIHGVPVLDQNDTITKWYGTCTDIDDMKRAGDMVLQNEQLLHSIIENVSSGVALIDETGKFEVYNPVFLKLFGLSPDATIKNVNDQDWSQWQVFDENKNLLQVDDHPVRKAAITGKLVKNQLVAMILPSGGDYIWMMISAEPLHKEDGTIDKIICTYHDITESKKAEEALRKSEEQLRLAQKASGAGAWDWDIPKNELNWAPEFFELMGLDATNQIANFDTWSAVLHPEDLEKAAKILEDSIANHLPLENEYRIIRPDGKTRWIYALGNTTYNKDDKPLRMSGICIDITERKKAEEAIKKSEQLYRAIGESIDYGVWVCDADGRNTYASESYLKLVGMTQEQCSDFGWGDTLHPDDAEHTIEAWKKCAKTGEKWDIEHRFKGVDGNWHPILARGIPLRDEKGNITGWAGINLDISNIKKAEEALKESENRFRIIAQSIPVQISISSAKDATLLFSNPLYDQTFGYSPGELLGKKTPDLYFDPKDRLPIIDMLKENGRVDAYEVMLKKVDGSPFWVSTSIITIIYEGQQAYLGSFIDITKRKQAEKTLKDSEEKYLTTLSSIGDAVIATDSQGIITFLNPVAEQLTGWTMKESINRPAQEVFRIFNEFTNKVTESPIDKVIQQGKTVAIADHTILMKKDGGKVPIDDSGAPIRDYEGNIIGVVLVFRDITNRKITEENRTRLASIIETSDDAIISKDMNDIITTWNRGAEIIFGYNAKDILGKPISTIIPPGYENEEMRITNKIIKGYEVKHYETKRICKDGSIVDVSVSVSPQHDYYGRLTGVSKIIRNITESKKDRYELIRLNRTLQALGESSQAMMYSTDETNYLKNVCRIVVEDCGHLMAWIGFAMDDPDKSVKPVTSYGLDEGYTETLNISWADTPNGHGPTGQAIQTAKPVVCRHINTDSNFEPWRKDALDRGFASSIVIPLIDQIKVIGALNIYSKEPDPFTKAEIELLSDIAADLVHGINTLRLRNSEKVALEMLTASEKKLWSVLHATQESIYMFDREGKFLLSNAIGLKRLNNIEADKLIGHHFSEFMTDELAKQRQIMFDKVLQSGKPVEFIDERKGITFHHNFFPVFDRNEVSYIVVYSVDITQRVEYENALEEKNLELQEINATKDKFFSIIAHDMKNPFISLLGASEMLYENVSRYDKKRIKELSKILNDSAKSGYNMLLNLLEWARSQAGSMVFTPEPINLKELIDKNLLYLYDTASAKEINLNFTVDDQIELFADRNMLNSILRNLVNNALKFTPRGGLVTVGSTIKNNSQVIFVKDTGVGIANSDFEKLFRKDIKYSHPGTDHEIGTGLGLLLCQEFVEKHGGKIWVESTVGIGSTFYFSISK